MRRGVLFTLTAIMACMTRAQSEGDTSGPAIIGYYAGDGSDLYSREIGKLTHVIWCFLHLQGDSVAPLDRTQEKELRHLTGLKREKPMLKVLLSFGGWGGCATCSEVFGTEQGRTRFSRSVHELLKRTWTDGIDLDWEYPVVQGPPDQRSAPEDRHNFTLLVRELRRELGDGYEISFAAGGLDECLIQGFEWDSIMPVVDRVHIMSYDLVHGFSTVTGHHTPLYSCAKQPASADHAVRLLVDRNVPKEKIVIGSAFYARVFSVNDIIGNGLFRSGKFVRTVPWSAMDTTVTEARGWKWFRDEKAGAPYAFNRTERLFLTGDDSVSVALKADYVRAQHLGGIMFWQLRDDRPDHGLLDVIYRRLR